MSSGQDLQIVASTPKKSVSPRFSAAHSFSSIESDETLKPVGGPSSHLMINGSIPVSPRLKTQVQKRLYELVNEIDGYIPDSPRALVKIGPGDDDPSTKVVMVEALKVSKMNATLTRA